MAGRRALSPWRSAPRAACWALATIGMLAQSAPVGAAPEDVALTPPAGPAGTVVSIVGSGCRDGTAQIAVVTVSGPTLGVDLVVATEQDGTWAATFTVPAAAAQGDHQIDAACVRGSAQIPYAPVVFTRTPGPPPATTAPPSTTGPAPTTAPPPETAAPPTATPSTTTAPSSSSTASAPSSSTSSRSAPAVTQAPASGPRTTIVGNQLPTTPGSPDAPASLGTSGTTAASTEPGSPSTLPIDDSATEIEPEHDAPARSTAAPTSVDASPSTSPPVARLVIGSGLLAATGAASFQWRRGRRNRVGAALLAVGTVDGSGTVPPEATATVDPEAQDPAAGTALIPSAQPPSKFVQLDLGRGVLALAPSIQAAVGRDAALELDVEAGACLTWLREGDLEHLVLPLVRNAAHGVVGGGLIRIATGRGPCAAVTSDETDWALLVVADTGAGISAGVLADLRAAFSDSDTPRDAGHEPTSLVAAHDLAAALGGHLDVSSVPGRGTTVTVALPLCGAYLQPAAALDPDA